MSRIVEIIRRVVLEELARNRGSLLGVVTTVYPHEAADDENNYEANVRLKHEDLELRRVPIAVGHVGVAAPPRVGDLVLVQFLNGDSNQPLVTGRFYHADERPPLHREDEILFEHRVSDDTLNHLRFAADGAIYLQREVKKPEDNSEATTSIKVEAEGNLEIRVGEKITMRLTLDDNVQIVADGLPITVDCDTLTVNGDLTVSNGSNTTTISGNEITGA
ncbi:MAG: phage baseplate assembly protein V [Actinomycetota bacterium]|nr:phage baseplate assembly protein V [Actinomycetota bacterium]